MGFRQSAAPAARGKITVNYASNRLYYCVVFSYKQFTNVAAGLSIQAGGPRVGNPC
jgi:hypothetical protein